jgi:predicted dithiol-disulfide oxidoreductase (DUF899 family)
MVFCIGSTIPCLVGQVAQDGSEFVRHSDRAPGVTSGSAALSEQNSGRCPSCSFLSDHIDGALVHLAARDGTLAMVSRAPLAKIDAFKKRMGWRFKWVSSFGSEFNYDFHVSFKPEEMDQGKVHYNYVRQEFPSEEAPGISVLPGHGRRGLSHLLDFRARP